jgi:hypothetical protein
MQTAIAIWYRVVRLFAAGLSPGLSRSEDTESERFLGLVGGLFAVTGGSEDAVAITGSGACCAKSIASGWRRNRSSVVQMRWRSSSWRRSSGTPRSASRRSAGKGAARNVQYRKCLQIWMYRVSVRGWSRSNARL